jgi:hypothetical protein
MQSLPKAVCIGGAIVALSAAAATAQAQTCKLAYCEALPEDLQVRLQQYCLFKPADNVCRSHGSGPKSSASPDDPDPPLTRIPREYFEDEQPPVHVAPFQVKLWACPRCPGNGLALQITFLMICTDYHRGKGIDRHSKQLCSP